MRRLITVSTVLLCLPACPVRDGDGNETGDESSSDGEETEGEDDTGSTSSSSG